MFILTKLLALSILAVFERKPLGSRQGARSMGDVRLMLEPLEDRLAPTAEILWVNSNADPSDEKVATAIKNESNGAVANVTGTLRLAITKANQDKNPDI